ncbi:MAG: archease [Methylobacter sp.]|uniref:archease n=1 Tax=Methylobacter sp. TaxID=2051955 RepID=UPI00258607F7|nr:archease [Methylobacter sp.]MCL7422847.1 archease [Methylobacter sp.]
MSPYWEHFEHQAYMGIRGIAPTLNQDFEQAAPALTAVIADPAHIPPSEAIRIHCTGRDNAFPFPGWINERACITAVNGLLFDRFQVSIDDEGLTATTFGEAVDRRQHQPAVKIQGAALTEPHVYQQPDGLWVTQCVVDV